MMKYHSTKPTLDYLTPVTPILNGVTLGKKKYHRTVVTCGICGNILHPYSDRIYCRHCRTSVNWKDTGITPSNFRYKNVRYTNNHNIY